MFSSIKSYLELCRVSNLPTVLTNVLAATVVSGGACEGRWFLVLFVSMGLFYSGGMCLNDIIDAPADAKDKPFRPIPSDRISVRAASFFTALLFAAALTLLLLVPYKKAFWGGLLLLFFIIVYDTFHKQRPLSVLLMAACRLMIFVISAFALTGSLAVYPIVAAMLQFFYVVIISLTARHENSRGKPFAYPVIPLMIAGISLIDGLSMAVFASPFWFAAGIGGAFLTWHGQRYIRGD
jgi:4-hydroxybenzoate polyprenyltransferase